MALLNIALCIPLAKYYGEIGCACATAICLIIGSGFAINWYYARIGLDLKQFFSNLGKISIGICLAVIFIAVYFCLSPLYKSWFSLVLHGIILTILYSIFMWFISFNNYEKQLILEPIKKIKYKFYK